MAIQYGLLLNDERIPYLVKEREFLCKEKLNSPEVVVQVVESMFSASKLPEEHVFVLATNTSGGIVGVFAVSHGSVSITVINPREAFIRLLLCGAAGFFLVHNHPSGSVLPSRDDCRTTRIFKEAGELMGLSLLDHVIMGTDGGFYSFREHDWGGVMNVC